MPCCNLHRVHFDGAQQGADRDRSALSHAGRNALLPVVTAAGAAAVDDGVLFVETVFAIPAWAA